MKFETQRPKCPEPHTSDKSLISVLLALIRLWVWVVAALVLVLLLTPPPPP